MDPIDLTSLDIAVQSNDATKNEDNQKEAAEQLSERTSEYVMFRDDRTAPEAKFTGDDGNSDGSADMLASDDDVDSSEEDNFLSSDSDEGMLDITDSSHEHHDEVFSETIIDAADPKNDVDEALTSEVPGVKLMQPSEGEGGTEAVKNTESSDAEDGAVDASIPQQQTDNTLPSNDGAHNEEDSLDGVHSELDQGDESTQVAEDFTNQTETSNNETAIENEAQQANETNAKNNTEAASPEIEDESKEDDEDETPRQILVDYAAKVSGGQILEKSPTLKGTSNLLTGDMDRYAIAPCEDKKYVVVGLSEDILVKMIQLANYERYSSHVKDFQVLASQEYPTQNNDQWTDLGTYTALSKNGEQSFELKEAAWARYLKFKFLSHYGVEHYCTVSQIKVHGSTMLQGFHEQWIESEMDNAEEVDGDDVDSNQNDVEEEQIEEEGEEEDSTSVNEEKRAILDENSEQHEQASEPTKVDRAEDGTDPDDIESAQDEISDELCSSDEPEPTVQGTDVAVDADDVKQAEQRSNDNADIAITMEQTNNIIEPPMLVLSEGYLSEHKSDIEQVNVPEHNEPPVDETLDKSHVKKEGDALKETTPPIDKSMTTSEAKEDGMESSISSKDKPVTIESERKLETHSDNENNSTIHAVADAVLGLGKAAVAHVTDELKHVKEAVQSADTVTEIKKMIRTTIAVTEEGSETELDAMKELTIIDQDSEEANIVQPVRDLGSDKKTKQNDSVIDEDNDTTIDEQEDESSVEPELPDNNEACGENSTNATEKVNSPSNNITTTNSTTQEEWSIPETVPSSSRQDKASAENNKTQSIATSTSKANQDKTSSEKNKTHSIAATTLKVNQTATFPQKRDSNKKSVEDHMAQLIAKYPDASCIKDLDFQTFKASLKAKQSVVGAAVGAAGVRTMEPVFQKITSEIKSVQSTQHQYEQFVSAIKVCYEKVLAGIADDVDVMQSNFDSRLTVLEMMILERRDVERNGPPNFFGLSIQNIFPISTLAALRSNEIHVYLAVAVVFILILRVIRVKGKKVAMNSVAAANEHKNVNVSPDKVHFNGTHLSENNMTLSLSKQKAMGSEMELSHIISCDESDDSMPLPRSEKTGTFRSTSVLAKGSQRDLGTQKDAKSNIVAS